MYHPLNSELTSAEEIIQQYAEQLRYFAENLKQKRHHEKLVKELEEKQRLLEEKIEAASKALNAISRQNQEAPDIKSKIFFYVKLTIFCIITFFVLHLIFD